MVARATPNDGLNKFQRHRARRQANGMKLLRIWVPDPHAPGFRDQAEARARLLPPPPGTTLGPLTTSFYTGADPLHLESPYIVCDTTGTGCKATAPPNP
jgi:hypothetical protein